MLQLHYVAMTFPNGVRAVLPISLSVPKGQFLVLLGPSGAGKSTLLRCLNGLLKPTQGDVTVEGLGSIFSNARTLRKHRIRTGMIFQQHHLIGRLTALQNVMVGRLGAHSTLRSLFALPLADRLLALQSLERVGLLERALDRADELSGGQQQRIGIARAMAQKPQFVLADEPVASLDPATGERVLADLHRICREDGITAIVSLHQIDLARQFADRVIGLANGRIVYEGSALQLSQTILDQIYLAAPSRMAAA
ncbi:phosphonate ABC transporter ATP-binding protein [Bradyrhizobium erythrophlei]|uniref:Phosphonate transport system ATP-binding protein n=1 Tax=Bradyrhizobium erythrophlei TaxID=1437360 RepID=A0A1M7SX74_9BRAD|nr:phosphonate ABC transporter ATP-binding protein [Bradyrhizobium erythrophlei]SHN63072.1 phosphonate transport system ATP-binding protein [Bradyrhizobium erythrophlei]